MSQVLVAGVEIRGAAGPRDSEVLTPEALEFVARLHRKFDSHRRGLLMKRAERQARIDNGELPDFLPNTIEVREGNWAISPVPAGLQDRRVEITGPVERKMVINALNSGARMFMADFEDANSPTWRNNVDGHVNLRDAVRGTIEFIDEARGKEYRLGDNPATLLVRPRGWHLLERHLTVDGDPVAGSFVDFGLYAFHNTAALLERGKGPWFYLPKLESHLEARLWNDVFTFAEDELEVPRGTMRATVLIETILAAFEMDEILYELREHAAGLNAGRWDYIFSMIKKFRSREGFTLPDRAQVTMTVPFMRAYAELLVKTCHHRGAHAMGGMAAFIPSRRDAAVNETALTAVRADKQREAEQGFDGTWVAHPDLVAVALEQFDAVLGDRPNQLERQREDVSVTAAQLLDTAIPGSSITDAGLRMNVSVGIQYVGAWLRGNGAVAINNLMEDAATAEISRSQVWQWAYEGASLEDGRTVDDAMVRAVVDEELSKLLAPLDAPAQQASGLREAAGLFERLALSRPFEEFLTLPAYEELVSAE